MSVDIQVLSAFWQWCKENNYKPTNKRYEAFKAGAAYAAT